MNGFPRVPIFPIATVGRFTVCINLLVYVCHEKFPFIRNHYYNSINDLISRHSEGYFQEYTFWLMWKLVRWKWRWMPISLESLLTGMYKSTCASLPVCYKVSVVLLGSMSVHGAKLNRTLGYTVSQMSLTYYSFLVYRTALWKQYHTSERVDIRNISTALINYSTHTAASFLRTKSQPCPCWA